MPIEGTEWHCICDLWFKLLIIRIYKYKYHYHYYFDLSRYKKPKAKNLKMKIIAISIPMQFQVPKLREYHSIGFGCFVVYDLLFNYPF